jgi:mRNA-degrading endonuclease RelE of RelBE toxin-antitoxin system
MTYRAELSARALKQLPGLPGPAFDSLITAMAEVVDYPDDPLRTFPTSDPYVRRVQFGDAGLITYLVNDGAQTVVIFDITWTG